MAILKTKRLILRPIVKGDLNLIFEYAKNPKIGPRAGWKPHESKSESKNIMNELFIGQKTIWAITIRGDDSFRGIVGLENDPKRSNSNVRMIGYWLNEGDWGKGYMTEAAKAVFWYGFTKLELPLITANCFTFNDGSRKILEKLGMKYEGCLRQAEERFDKKIFDLYFYSLTRDEYLQAK